MTKKNYDEIVNINFKDKTKIKSVLTDSTNVEVPIPVGATYVDGTEKTGVIITYKGSEFVWIPVKNPIYDSALYNSLPRSTTTGSLTSGHDYTPMAINTGTAENPVYKGILYNFSTTYGGALKYPSATNFQGTTSQYREPADLQNTTGGDWATTTGRGFNLIKQKISGFEGKTNNQIKTDWINLLQSDYNAMVESVNKYGGFYIARYEGSSVNNTIASIPGVKPLMNITWYETYQRCKNFSGDNPNDTLQSQMLWGSQFDAMLNWILTGDDKSKLTSGSGNRSGSLANTGAIVAATGEPDLINNIYDLDGNLFETTATAYNTSKRTYRSRLLQCKCKFIYGSYYYL